VSKDLTGLRDAVKQALQEIVTDGTYGQILSKYDISQGALKTITVNAGS